MSRINVLFRKLRFGSGLVLAVFIVTSMAARLYADAATWATGDLPILAVGNQVSAPTVSNGCTPTSFTYFSYTKPDGSFDSLGRNITQSVCMVQDSLGSYGAASNITDDDLFVKPNTMLAFHVVKPNGSQIAVTPIPGQAVFFTKDSSGSAYGEVAPHFYDTFTSAGTFGQFTVGSTKELALQVNQAGTVLKDAASKTIYMHAYAFSANGEWMVIEAANLGLLRVNTVTRQMQLFSTGTLSYNLGFTPKATLAISDDGNSVIKSGKNASDTDVYDLSGCLPGSFTINGNNAAAVQGCKSRDVYSSLRSQLSGFDYLTGMQFSPDGKSITGFAERTGALGASEYFAITYSVAGYQAPQLTYLALGDSFSSGEGAYDYEPGTNVDANTCHLSQNSYPYLAALALGLSSFHSVACSGAETVDYKNAQVASDNPPSDEWTPGFSAQKNYLHLAGKTSVITISMIGNDIGFADKLKVCIFEPASCYHFKEDRQSIAEEIYRTFDDKLVPLYQSIKADSGNPGAVKVYVLGYPQILGTEPDCAPNVPFSQEERQMANGLITYLDAVIKAATQKAGVQYIDTEHAFDGHRLCDDGEPAVNGLTADGNMPLSHFTAIANSSFHPNAFGQQLLANVLLAQSSNFTKTMAAADASITAPYVGSDAYNALLGDAPSGGTLSHLLYIGDQTADVVLKAANLPISVINTTLQPNSTFAVWFNSTPTFAGTLTSDANGQLNGSIAIPAGVTPGYHTVHIYGKDVGGQGLDLYKVVYVAAAADDYNGDGIPNDQDPCLTIPASGIDQDKDGTDDACDPDIEPAPIDTIPPIVTGTPDRQPDQNGWYNHGVTINWAASDPEPGSGAPLQPAPTVADQDGNHIYASEPTCDPAGNCASGNVEIKLDETPPTISASVSLQANTSGWNNSPVTVTFTCGDATSGIASCSQPITISTDGIHTVTGTAEDNAGNAATATASINIDTTLPTVSGMEWSNNSKSSSGSTALTVHVTDNLSGVVAAEYYLGDTDPGQGNGTALAPMGSDFVANFGSNMPTGTYTVHVRAVDAAGNWSSISTTKLTVAAAPKSILSVLRAIVNLLVTLLRQLF